MSSAFRAVQWNRTKLVYDGILLVGVTLYIGGYLILAHWLDPPKDLPAAIDLRVRAFGSCAFFMLTIILSIGPLARLDRRFLPMLYNRRHFGVLTFLVALVHASFMVEWYAVQNALPSLYDELTKLSDYGKFIGFPFKALGIVTLLILFLMAATSHDYWLVFLTPSVWKRLHMALYAAYGLVVMHVALGVMHNAGKRLCPRDAAPCGRRLARARGRSRRRPRQRRLARSRATAVDPGQRCAHCYSAGRRTHCSFPRWHADRGALQSLRPPEWADRGGAHHRRLCDLPVARLSVPFDGWLRAAALHREARHLPRAHRPRRCRG